MYTNINIHFNEIKMFIRLILITLILNDCTVAEMLGQSYLTHLNFKDASQTHIITQLEGITVYQCFEECYYRRKCKSFNYRRKFQMCKLNAIESGGDVELVKTHEFVYSEKLLWDMSMLPYKCNQCMEQERCWPESSAKACVKQECSPPEKGPHEHLLGNLFSIGNRLKLVNDNSGGEKIYTCSELPDIGTVLGGECIYSCVMENCECKAGKCSCLSGYGEVDGYCIPGCNKQVSPFKDCNDVKDNNCTTSGVYKLNPLGSSEEFNVYCDLTTDGGGWLVFQRREDGSVNFYRGWNDYETGFGDVSGEFWLGNRLINSVTSQDNYELRVDLEDFEGNTNFAKYSVFKLGDSVVNYQLTVSGYSGNAGDSLSYHSGRPFSTFDRDFTTERCASKYTGAWWYLQCLHSNLNGQYLRGLTHSCAKGVDWLHWKGHCYSLKKTEMKIRRV